MFLLIIIIYIAHSNSQRCISYLGSPDECFACSSGYFQLFQSSKLFPESECIKKDDGSYEAKILILSKGAECNQDCRMKFSYVYDSIRIAFSEQSALASRRSNASIEFFLSLGQHFILPVSEDTDSGNYFRWINASIKLGPLSCEIFSQKELCVPKEQKIVINVKSNNLMLFISKNLEVRLIKFRALDQHYKVASDACMNSSTEDCCSPEKIDSSTEAEPCSLSHHKIDFESRLERTWGLFNFETPPNYMPQTFIQFNLENCEFNYFYLVNQRTGFMALFTVLWNTRVQFQVSNCSFSENFFLKGFIYFEKKIDEAVLEPWFANIDDSLRALIISSSNNLKPKNFVNIQLSSFTNYNTPLIEDNRKLEEKSLFIIDTYCTDVVFSNIVFDNHKAQENETQAIFLIESSNNLPLRTPDSCVSLRSIVFMNISNFMILSGSGIGCINIDNISVQESAFDNIHAVNVQFYRVSITNSIFEGLLNSKKSLLINFEYGTIFIQNVLIIKSFNSRISLESSVCQLINITLYQIVFSNCMLQIKSTSFLMVSSIFKSIRSSEDQQGIFLYQQGNNTLFKGVYYEDISAFNFKFMENSNSSSFDDCTFFAIIDVSNFLAADSIYAVYLLKNSSILNCSFLNFYFSLNGNRFTVQPKIYLHALVWKYFVIRVGFFCAFSNVQLEIKDSEIKDMVGIVKDNFVRFFYIGRSSSFLMENSSIIDCGYNFEPVLKEYAYNYLIFFGQLIYPLFKIINSVFITNKPLSLKTGFVTLNRIPLGKVSIINCSFIVNSDDELSHNGVTFTVTNEIEFINNTLKNIRCPKERVSAVHEWGAVFMLGEETQKFFKNNKVAFVSGNYFENCSCRGGAGLTIINYHNISIENNLFKNNSAWFQIGSLGIWSSTNVVLRANVILFSFSPAFGAVKIEDVRNISIEKMTVENAASNTTAVVYIAKVSYIQMSNIFVNNIETYSSGGVMYFGNAKVTILDSDFTNIKTQVSGGVFFIDIFSDFFLRNCTMQNVEAFSGGVLAVFIGGNISITNVTLLNVSSLSNGAAFLFEQFFRAHIMDIYILNSKAGENGVITFETIDEALELSLRNITCIKNRARAGSCIYINSKTNVTITNVIVKECEGVVLKILSDIKIFANIRDFLGSKNIGDNLLGFENIFLMLERFVLVNNDIEKALLDLNMILKGNIKAIHMYNDSPMKNQNFLTAIKIGRSQIVFEEMEFNFTSSMTQSTAIYAVDSKLILMFAFISGSVSYDNFGAFRFIDSLVQAYEIDFSNNYGVCVKGSGFGGTFKRIRMSFNEAVKNFESAHFDYTSSTNSSIMLILECVHSTLQKNGSSLKLSGFSNIVINNCLFKTVLSSNITQQGANNELRGIEAVNILSLNIVNSLFESFTTKGRGSALFVTDDVIIGGNVFASTLLIMNTSFVRCSSYKGAGTVLITNKKRVLIDSNIFKDNEAKTTENRDISEFEGVGAVGMILCFQSSSLIDLCRTNLINNSFEDNYAFFHSPLFYINSSMNIARSFYVNNTDQINFTKTISSNPPDIKMMFPIENLGQKAFSLNFPTLLSTVSFLHTEFTENAHVLELRSGALFNITFCITDNQDNILVFDDFSYASIDVVGEFIYQIKIENGVTKADKGWFNFSNARIFGWPDSTVSFEFSFKIPQHLIVNPEPVTLKNTVYVHFSPCFIGEIILNDLSCSLCPYNSFSTLDPMIAIKGAENHSNILIPPMKCSPCLNKAHCPGGSAIFPKEGSWRLNNVSENIIDCMIPQACTGHDANRPILENSLGLCKIGHYGNLCHDCVKDYGKVNSNFTCGECGEVLKMALVRLIIAVFMIIGYAILGSYIYSHQGQKKKGYLFVYLRVGISFSQITSLVTYIKIEWPMIGLNQFQSISSNSLSMTSEDVLLNDCFIHELPIDVDQTYIFKMILSLFLPLALFLLSSLIWLMIILITSYRKLNLDVLKDFYMKIIACLIISVFLFNPLVIRTSLNLLNCFLIDPSTSKTEVLFVYPNFQCWSSFHIRIISLAVIPGIVIWGIGFPIGLYFLLVKHIRYREVSISQKDDNDEGIERKSRYARPIRILNLEADRQKIYSPQAEKSGSIVISQGIEFINSQEINFKKPNRKISKLHRLNSLIVKSNLLRFLYHGYKEEYPFWEFLIFLKKFALSLLINFIQMIGFEMVNLLILLTLSFHLYLHITIKPYKIKTLNNLQFLCILGSILIFLSVIILQANINVPTQYFFALIIFISYTVCLGYTAYLILMSLKKLDIIKKLLSMRFLRFMRELKDH